MGLLDRIFGNTKPKQLTEAKTLDSEKPDNLVEKNDINNVNENINVNGRSLQIYFNPKDWQQMDEDQKFKSVVVYSISETRENLVNIISENQQGDKIEINLLRYKNSNLRYSVKDVTELIISILNSQGNENIPKTSKIKNLNILQDILNINNGEFSKEGQSILKNSTAETILLNRTIFINKGIEGIKSYKDKDDIGLINSLINTINDKSKMVKKIKSIDIETEELDEKYYTNDEEKKDILMGIINLCKIADDIGIIERKQYRSDDDASGTYEKIKKIAPTIENEQRKLREYIEKTTIDACIKLENLIEEFNSYKLDFIIYSPEEDEEIRYLLQKVLLFSKQKFKEQVEKFNIENKQKEEMDRKKEEREKEYIEQEISFYKKTIEELTNTVKELTNTIKKIEKENRELLKANQRLSKKLLKLEEDVDKLRKESISHIRNDKEVNFIEAGQKKNINEEIVRLLSKSDKELDRQNVYGFLNYLKEENLGDIDENKDINAEKDKNEDIDIEGDEI